jgi:hypothetical protein
LRVELDPHAVVGLLDALTAERERVQRLIVAEGYDPARDCLVILVDRDARAALAGKGEAEQPSTGVRCPKCGEGVWHNSEHLKGGMRPGWDCVPGDRKPDPVDAIVDAPASVAVEGT